MEDRLRSYMYYIGALYKRDSYKANEGKAVPFLREIVLQYKDPKEPKGLTVSSISGKKKILKSVLRWTENVSGVTREQKYLYALKSQCESLDIQELLSCLERLDQWCAYRNEVIHGLLNKNIESANSQLLEKVEEGMDIARYLDSQLRILNKGDRIRRSVNLPMN